MSFEFFFNSEETTNARDENGAPVTETGMDLSKHFDISEICSLSENNDNICSLIKIIARILWNCPIIFPVVNQDYFFIILYI